MNIRFSMRDVAAAPFRRRLCCCAATALAGSLWAAAAQADPLIVGNNGGPIQTYDFATGGAPVNFFTSGCQGVLPIGGVAVLGNKVYHAEIEADPICREEQTRFIEVVSFNGGAGGACITDFRTPLRGSVHALAVANGVLYALKVGNSVIIPPEDPCFRPLSPQQVLGLDPVTGAVVSGPVTITGPVTLRPIFSDGFTVLPNGNFLINNSVFSCTYNQYDPSSGALIPGTTITVPGSFCRGVDTNGVHLFFATNGNSFTETDLTGFVIATKAVTVNSIEDISLVTFGASGVPGKPSCHGKTVSDLAKQYGTIDKAASALAYSSVAALQDAIKRFCASP